MVANGIVISQLCYLIQLWGGSEGYLLNSLQIIMNRAARSVTGYNCFMLHLYKETLGQVQLVKW